ncbi:MAG: hypothetical protein H0T56_14565 [Pseudaminobacter sp.]|nr:hypothetical protein [Pseudaminobacter sp.]
MSITITPFLRNALTIDAIVSAVAGVGMAAGGWLLAPLLDLPQSLLFWAGLSLFPWAAVLFTMARRETVARLVLIDIIAVNALWVAGSFGLLVSGAVEPTALGYAFVIAQALAVAFFTKLQIIGLRRSGRVAA